MDLIDIQRFAVAKINADPILNAAGCIAVVEDKGDAFAEVNAAVEGGLCAIVLLPKWSPRSSAAKNAVGNADLVVNLTEIPDLNRERPDAIHGLTAAQRIAWLLNMEKVADDACSVLTLANPGIQPAVQEDGRGVVYSISFVQQYQLTDATKE